MTSDMTSEERPVKMTGHEDNAVRMAGYLDKRGKMKLVTIWKRYWFVLKDQLLLYYKSQTECLNLSACRGSLNMGIVSSVRPGAHRGPPATAAQDFTIEVVTRTQVVVLRTKNRSLQEQWLKALLESMALPNISPPFRPSGGPVHFRYSIENLPVLEEVKTEENKLETSPHQTSFPSHDNVLGRIKRIGGQSYGGGLDTILRHQPKSHVQQHWSPQQPNIPRIKAVDRMLGAHNLDSTENSEIMLSENQSGGLGYTQKFSSESESILSVSKDEVLIPNGEERIKCNEVPLKSPVTTSSGIQEIRETNFKLRADESNKQTKAVNVLRSENQNHKKFNVINIGNARKCTADFQENERYVCSLENEGEILVENRLYEKSKKVENEDEDKLYEETNEIQENDGCYDIENKLYKESKVHKEAKQYDSVEELSSFSKVHNIPGDEKMYDVVSTSVDAVKQTAEDAQSSEDEEDEYYCSYDKFSLMHLLSDECNSSSPEPDLPPRPSVGSNDAPKTPLAHENTKTDDEEAECSLYYESTESYNNSTPPSNLLMSGGDGSEKKRSKLRARIKLRKKKAKRKEPLSLEDGNNNKKTKRKMSFLSRMLRHKYKKPGGVSKAVVVSDNRPVSDEPEYESVDYVAAIFKHDVAEEELPEHAIRSKSMESLDKALLKERVFGAKNLLTEQTLCELKKKLKDRDNATLIESAASVNEDNERHEGTSSSEVVDRKPIPIPRSKKQNLDYNNKDLVVLSSRYRCNDSIIRENKPPSLPPRRVARPRSPCHDIPKNNSPVYGNIQDFGIMSVEKEEDRGKEISEESFEKQSAPLLDECNQEFQDELLGTPHGFVYVQNKWKAAEKSSERFHDQQVNKGKSSFQKNSQKEILSGKCSDENEVGVKHIRITRDDNAWSEIHEDKIDTVLVANTSSFNVCGDVHEQHLSTKMIIKDFNSQTENHTTKGYDLSETYSQMVDNELSIENGRGTSVQKNSTEFEFNGNPKVKIGCTKIKHSDVCDDSIVKNINGKHGNFILNTTLHDDFSDDISVTLKKLQTSTMSTCNRGEILFNETEKSLALINSKNEDLYSSQCQNARDCKEAKEKEQSYITNNDCACSDSSSISTDSLGPEDFKTLCNTSCNENVILNAMAKDLSDGALDKTGPTGYKDTTPHLHRHSDELNLLLAQLAEITSAPLLPHGVASSLVDIPEAKKPKPQANEPSQLGPTQQQSFVLGPIRRRRHSDPDYDVPRPHGSLLHLLLLNGTPSHPGDHGQSGEECDPIEATRFFGDVDMSSSSAHSSLSLRDRVISEVDEHSDISYYISMAPDSLEVPLNKDIQGSM